MSDIPKLVPVRMAASVSQQRRHIADVVRGVGRLPLHCGGYLLVPQVVDGLPGPGSRKAPPPLRPPGAGHVPL